MARTTEQQIDTVIGDTVDYVAYIIRDDAKRYPFFSAPSPLERIVGMDLFTCVFLHNAVAAEKKKHLAAAFYPETKVSIEDIRARKAVPTLSVWHQVCIGNYVADFIVRFCLDDQNYYAAVECDGHDFHERTKEQAAHDRARDRFFQSEGLAVMRFTGSEIWRAPGAVSREIVSFFNKKLG